MKISRNGGEETLDSQSACYLSTLPWVPARTNSTLLAQSIKLRVEEYFRHNRLLVLLLFGLFARFITVHCLCGCLAPPPQQTILLPLFALFPCNPKSFPSGTTALMSLPSQQHSLCSAIRLMITATQNRPYVTIGSIGLQTPISSS